MAAALSGCTSTTQLLFKGTTTISAASPLLILSRRRRLYRTAVTGLTNNRENRAILHSPKTTPLVLSNFANRTSTLATGRGRMLQSLSCYCTEAQSSQNTATATATVTEEGAGESSEESKIREAANLLEIRVGRILKAWRHEEADSLYVEEVDVGEPEPRTICSGLVNYIPLDRMQDRNVIVLANLKPRNMRGVKSFGMLMAASDASHEKVELLVPPEGSVPGERIWFGSVEEKENLPDAASPNQIQKKKIWELVQPHLKTDEFGAAALLGAHSMRTSAGVVTSESLKNANIS